MQPALMYVPPSLRNGMSPSTVVTVIFFSYPNFLPSCESHIPCNQTVPSLLYTFVDREMQYNLQVIAKTFKMIFVYFNNCCRLRSCSIYIG